MLLGKTGEGLHRTQILFFFFLFFLTHDYIIKILAALITIFISLSGPYHENETYKIKIQNIN